MRELISDLTQRGIVYQVTDEKLAEEKGSITFYCGFDPTSDSLHVGHLFPLLTMRRFQLAGHKPIAVVGGATGMVGDPSGKSQERKFLSPDDIRQNVEGIKKELSKFLDFSGPNAAAIANNYDWFEKISFLEFLRDVGKHFTVNHMIQKESVRARLEDREHGISYTEFSYMLLQGYDFYHLFKHAGCRLQIGGSDQWGNITAGTELIRRMNFAHGEEAAEVFGLTMPLLLKSDGQKFGKSESGAVWLNRDRTSPYQFYQFLLQTADADVERFLKLFSFKPLAEINAILTEQAKAPEKRLAQYALAEELTELVHGRDEVTKIKQASEALFKGDLKSLDEAAITAAFSQAPRLEIPKARLDDGVPLVDLLVETGLATSKGNARKDIAGGGIYVNDERMSDANLVVKSDSLIAGGRLVLRKGKKNYFLVQTV